MSDPKPDSGPTWQENLIVVIDRPMYAGNVGQACRAMANFGCTRLRVTGDLELNVAEARKMAMHAKEILLGAERYDTLTDAVADCTLVVGTTPRGHKTYTRQAPRELAPEVLAAAKEYPVAIVFGHERTGMTNLDLARCNRVCCIPTHPLQPSLNVAQAVLLVLYEMFTGEPGEPPDIESQPAEHGRLEAYFDQLQDFLLRYSFLEPQNPERIMSSIRRLIYRGRPSQRDVRILRGMLTQVDSFVRYVIPKKIAAGEEDLWSDRRHGARTRKGWKRPGE